MWYNSTSLQGTNIIPKLPICPTTFFIITFHNNEYSINNKDLYMRKANISSLRDHITPNNLQKRRKKIGEQKYEYCIAIDMKKVEIVPLSA